MFVNIFDLYYRRWSFFSDLIIDHLKIAGTSILFASILGILLGVFISEFKRFSGIVLGATNIVYTIPSISLLGFLIPLSGIGNGTAIIALTVYALLPMVRGTFTGIHNIDPSIIEAAKGMGSTKLQILYKVKLPLAMPVIISGIRNMVTMTIALAGIASFIGAGGLGVAVYRGITTNNAEMTVAGSILIAVIALLSDFFISRIEKHIKKKWRLN